MARYACHTHVTLYWQPMLPPKFMGAPAGLRSGPQNESQLTVAVYPRCCRSARMFGAASSSSNTSAWMSCPCSVSQSGSWSQSACCRRWRRSWSTHSCWTRQTWLRTLTRGAHMARAAVLLCCQRWPAVGLLQRHAHTEYVQPARPWLYMFLCYKVGLRAEYCDHCFA